MAKFEFTNDWLEGSTSARETTVPEFVPDNNVFVLKPIGQDDFKRWRREFRVCEHCLGAKVVQVSRTRQGKCPVCRGETPSLMDTEIRTKIFDEVCMEWRGWETKQGKPIPHTPEVRAMVCADNLAYSAILQAAQAMKVSITDADEGN